MISPPRIFSLGWLAVPFVAVIVLAWVHATRIQRVGYLSGLGGGSDPRPMTAAVDGERARHRTIVPEGTTGSYHWLLETDRMFARGEWRVRSIDYENAPAGRSVSAASAYRWWLGLVAWCDHRLTGRPLGRAVERAALIADPLLHLLLVLGTTLLVAWRFGRFSAALTALGLTVAFPLAVTFAGGAPDASALALPLTIWSALLLVAGLRAPSDSTNRGNSIRRWFFAAGVAGGLGLWIDPFAQLALLGGVAFAAVLAAWIDRQAPAVAVHLPWRVWAAGGAVTTLLAWLVEFAPDHLGGWRLASVHPLYAVAWLGAGEILEQITGGIRGDARPRSTRGFAVLALASTALAAPFVAVWKYQDRAALLPDPLAFRLTKLTETVDAQSVLVAVLPLLLMVPAGWLLLRRRTGHATRVSSALVLGPLIVAAAMACYQLSWWTRVDGLLVILLAVAAAPPASPSGTGFGRRGWASLAVVAFLPGLFLIVHRPGAAHIDRLTRSEAIALIERNLADWLAMHSTPGSAVVLAPPNETTALCYYGGLRGVGSLSWENKEGVAAAVRILSAPSAQEAKELVDQRGITHLVLLSWDTTFDAYARAGTGQIEGSFRDQLRFPTLPRWLRPLPYQLPTIEGFEDQTVTVFAVVDEQDEATAAAGMAEYLLEMGKFEQVATVEQALQQYPASLGAWVARADIQQARGDEGELAKSLDMLKRRLATKRPPALAWEQRVRLAVLLGKAKELKLAGEQVALCVEAADETKLRALSAGTLYRLLVLARHFDRQLEPRLQAMALELLPEDLRSRLK